MQKTDLEGNMVLIYGNFESIEGKEGTIVFPKKTCLYGSPNGDLIIKAPVAIHNERKGTILLTGIKRFYATKDHRSWWPKTKFKHTFSRGGVVYAGTNSKMMQIHGVKMLWKIFDYGTVSEEEYQKIKQYGEI
jgi:hypothetical protein